ncbi:MAG: tail sheath stabilizer and completion protein [Candidatus Dojkabacteria bacterium]|nr:tail sheath stabilizer and completion protein [Candidatus Dojkabacteria bacterium]
MYNYFYNKVLWTHVAAFADIFNEMSVIVYDKDGKAIGWKPVPVLLATREKVVSMLLKDPKTPDVDAPNYLPLISIQWKGISRNAERQRGLREKRKLLIDYEDPNNPRIISDMQTVPYDLDFEVVIWTKYMDDAAQLLENILPFFNPEAPVSLYERGIGTERQVKVTLESVSTNIASDISETERRIIQVNMSFKMECNFYKPQNERPSKPIKRVTVLVANENAGVNNQFTYDGDVVNTFIPPNITGQDTNNDGEFNYLDFDKEILHYKKQFDDEEIDYFTKVYNIHPKRFIDQRNKNIPVPHHEETNYLYDIPPNVYNNNENNQNNGNNGSSGV